ncbi:MAG TPA: ABC transporter ATP-binding protein [Longimicrobiaceae bacterium]|nr:ABC transporter ATP-binding protein [Longimicrobiaceae bacterium]
MSTPKAVTAPAVEMETIVKTFGPVVANRGASLRLAPGEIHALIGENGAGKSTLMRILSGMYEPDSGVVRVGGREVTGWSTSEAIAAGVGMVHQHFMLVPTLTVAENVMLGQEFTSRGQLDVRRAVEAVRELSERTGLRVDPEQTVGTLSVGEAQRVEILKTLFRGARILILDEPTAVLTPPEVDELWGVLRHHCEQGGTVVLITHKLDEVMEISEAVTVMRHGETVERVRTSESTPSSLARAMVGRDVALALEQMEPPAAGLSAGTGAALEVRDLTVRDARGITAVEGVSLSVAPGEILGIAGVEGNGQTELVEAIAGLTPVRGGSIHIGGEDVTKEGARARADLGLSHVPEDRQRRGLILDYSIADNLVLGLQHRFSRAGVLERGRIEENAREQIQLFDIRPADAALPARALSGGNQQKIVIAREMGRDFSVILAAQPTRGVDVGAIEFIHERLRAARDAGKAILLVSADLTEVLALSDRIAVMYEGRVVTVLPRAAASKEVLGPYMTGAQERSAAG